MIKQHELEQETTETSGAHKADALPHFLSRKS